MTILRIRWTMRGDDIRKYGCGCSTFVFAFCICMCSGCGDSSSTVPSSAQRDYLGLQFRLRRLPGKGDEANLVRFVEEIENTSQFSLKVDVHSVGRDLKQIKPTDLYPAEERCRSFPGGEGGESGGWRTLRPSETFETGSASFTIGRAGTYRLRSRLSACVCRSGATDIDMKECHIPSNDLEITVTNDLAEKGSNKTGKRQRGDVSDGERKGDGREKGRVERWRGGVGFDIILFRGFPGCVSIVACRAPFPPPAHRTGRADFPHPALGQGSWVRPRVATRKSSQVQ
jgi:hypothetical protein